MPTKFLRSEHTTWTQIHNQEIIFKHPVNRPARRNLFFHFVTSVLRREFFQPPDWFKDLDEITGFNDMWASPDPYLRRSTLQHLLDRVGKTETDGPLQKNAEQWLNASFKEKAPTPAGDEDPSTSRERVGDQVFENSVTSPDQSRITNENEL